MKTIQHGLKMVEYKQRLLPLQRDRKRCSLLNREFYFQSVNHAKRHVVYDKTIRVCGQLAEVVIQSKTEISVTRTGRE